MSCRVRRAHCIFCQPSIVWTADGSDGRRCLPACRFVFRDIRAVAHGNLQAAFPMNRCCLVAGRFGTHLLKLKRQKCLLAIGFFRKKHFVHGRPICSFFDRISTGKFLHSIFKIQDEKFADKCRCQRPAAWTRPRFVKFLNSIFKTKSLPTSVVVSGQPRGSGTPGVLTGKLNQMFAGVLGLTPWPNTPANIRDVCRRPVR